MQWLVISGSLLSFLQPLRGPSSSFVALRGFFFLAFVDNPQLFQASPAPGLPCGSFEGETGVFQARCQFLYNPCVFNLLNRFCVTRTQVLFQVSRAPAPHDGADHSEGKQPFVNEDEPPMNTNRHED